MLRVFSPLKKAKGDKLLEVGDIFIALITVMESWVHAHVQTHQIIYTKYVQFLYIIPRGALKKFTEVLNLFTVYTTF